MQKHELRNEQPPLEERDIELLIYGVFSGFDGAIRATTTRPGCRLEMFL